MSLFSCVVRSFFTSLLQGVCNVKAASGYMVKVYVCEFNKKANVSLK